MAKQRRYGRAFKLPGSQAEQRAISRIFVEFMEANFLFCGSLLDAGNE